MTVKILLITQIILDTEKKNNNKKSKKIFIYAKYRLYQKYLMIRLLICLITKNLIQ